MKHKRKKMKNQNSIFQYIRRSQLKRLPYSLFLLSISSLFLFLLFSNGPFSSVPVSSSSLITEEAVQNTPYISITASDLYYSGDDYMVNGRLKGHFYYSLESGTCQYYILKPTKNGAANFINQLTIDGKILESEELSLQLRTNMASRLNLSPEQLAPVISPVLISQPDFFSFRIFILLLLLLFSLTLSMISSIWILVCFLFPTCTKAYRDLKHYGSPKKILANVENELEKDCIIQTETMTLTKHYLIELSDHLNAIVPLKTIIWAYKIGSIQRRFPTFRKNMRYTLHLVTIDGRRYSFQNKKREEVIFIQEEMSRRYPNFFFGYSPEHEEMVRHMIREWKTEHRL